MDATLHQANIHLVLALRAQHRRTAVETNAAEARAKENASTHLDAVLDVLILKLDKGPSELHPLPKVLNNLLANLLMAPDQSRTQLGIQVASAMLGSCRAL